MPKCLTPERAVVHFKYKKRRKGAMEKKNPFTNNKVQITKGTPKAEPNDTVVQKGKDLRTGKSK